jgi:hypothetical protein
MCIHQANQVASSYHKLAIHPSIVRRTHSCTLSSRLDFGIPLFSAKDPNGPVTTSGLLLSKWCCDATHNLVTMCEVDRDVCLVGVRVDLALTLHHRSFHVVSLLRIVGLFSISYCLPTVLPTHLRSLFDQTLLVSKIHISSILLSWVYPTVSDSYPYKRYWWL